MTTPINEILVSIFDAADQGQIIDPVSAPQDNEPTSDGRDNVEVTAYGGITSIIDYVISTVGGDDTASLNGSPRNTSVNLGDGADVLNITTELLGGSISGSRFSGAAGNDTFNIIARGSGATTSTFEGGFGSDLINLTGNFSRVNVTGGADRDTLSFGEGSNFSTSFVGMGAEDDRVVDNGWAMNVSASSINGGGGDDYIDFGSSTADAGAQGTLFTGGAGDDSMYGTRIGENTMLAGAGDDFVQTFTDNDDLVGGGGCDTLILGDGADSALGGDGNDVVIAEDGQNTIDGGNNDDLVLGGVGDDSILGGADAGADTLVGAGDDDTIRGGSGNDIIFGDGANVQTANDFLFEQDFDLFGRDGNDVAIEAEYTNGLSASEIVNSITNGAAPAPAPGWRREDGTAPVPPGSETLVLTNGEGDCETGDIFAELNNAADESPYLDNAWRDAEFAQLTNNNQGNNLLFGDSGDDIVFGGDGNDTIDGGIDDDTIIGGRGVDSMTGGAGSDVFVQGFFASNNANASTYGTNWTVTWTTPGQAPDVVTDFQTTDNNGNAIDRIAFANAAAVTFSNANNEAFVVRDATGSANFSGWANGQVVVFRGEWSASNRRFATSNNGPDALAFVATQDGAALNGRLASSMDQSVVLLDVNDQTFTGANFFGTIA